MLGCVVDHTRAGGAVVDHVLRWSLVGRKFIPNRAMIAGELDYTRVDERADLGGALRSLVLSVSPPVALHSDCLTPSVVSGCILAAEQVSAHDEQNFLVFRGGVCPPIVVSQSDLHPHLHDLRHLEASSLW